jgi:ribonuclease BN (tRNA processing enzyme)
MGSYLQVNDIVKKGTILYSKISVKEKILPNETITFLGTGGARFMIISQKLASGGLWFNFNGTQILMDPGPGCIVHTNKNKLEPEKLSAIIVSHRHLDHSADVNIMTEAMTRGGFKNHGSLFAPNDAIETEPVILDYLKKRLDSIEVLEAGKAYAIGGISLKTTIRHHHRVENYGMIFKTGKHTVGYITDTSYFKGLAKHYRPSDLLLMNVTFLKPLTPSFENPNIPVDHLSIPDAECLIKEIKPKIAILTHFAPSLHKAKPGLIARQLTKKTGIRVIAARDGMVFDLADIDKI